MEGWAGIRREWFGDWIVWAICHETRGLQMFEIYPVEYVVLDLGMVENGHAIVYVYGVKETGYMMQCS